MFRRPARHVDAVGQTASPLVVGGNAAAVIGDVDTERVGDRDLDVQVGRARVPNSVADRLRDGSFGVLSQIGTHSGHRTGHVQRRDNASVLGEIGDHLLYPPTEPATSSGRGLQFEDRRADVLDRGLQIIDCAVEPVGDFR